MPALGGSRQHTGKSAGPPAVDVKLSVQDFELKRKELLSLQFGATWWQFLAPAYINGGESGLGGSVGPQDNSSNLRSCIVSW